MDDLKASISSAEFTRWMAWLEVEPDTGTRADLLAAVIAKLIGRVEGTMGGKPPTIDGRLIEWGRHNGNG